MNWMNTLPESIAYYVAKRVGCAFDDALDYVLAQRRYYIHLGLTHIDPDTDSMVMDESPFDFKSRIQDMCPFIANYLDIDPEICERMALAEREFICVHNDVETPVIDKLDQRLLELTDDQRKEVLPILQTLFS